MMGSTVQVRGYAELVDIGGTRFRFICPAGHSHIKDMGKGPVSRRLSASGARLMASWWSKEKGGLTFDCPKCAKANPGR